jgi:hypothetical protein
MLRMGRTGRRRLPLGLPLEPGTLMFAGT